MTYKDEYPGFITTNTANGQAYTRCAAINYMDYSYKNHTVRAFGVGDDKLFSVEFENEDEALSWMHHTMERITAT